MNFDLTSAAELLAFWAIAGYLLGAIPFGIVTARVLGLGDLRQIGSGNIGATNVLRTGSKLGAALTLIGDAGKAGAAVLLARALAAEDAAQIAGFAAFLGHCYPIWLKFKGGKGVATFFGLLFALAWPIGVAAGATWLATAAIFRFSSLAALLTAVMTPLWIILMGFNSLFLLSLCLTGVIYWRHRENIIRLIRGQESKIGQK
ncbi:glycerol-3-phosphate 1-O-acyltransferase PlsY [Planktomarina temperata]|jgi:glycerol-3-phosphate acyltransferase PlsY|uniref:glycerol-3-phosphate 1-O-acyltransferase PlsY n=1 Tax=Planktomarina temperata TaxID=1284658 RepID=UPI001D76EFD8|nr:glycerol-3-phosphate 1-O-acyltransferase PlsY [Planktomarina temperata]MBT7999648.1 glycerol-3-phosphate 1-O-acyltransferase PlsY [Planktomarina temperata]